MNIDTKLKIGGLAKGKSSRKVFLSVFGKFFSFCGCM